MQMEIYLDNAATTRPREEVIEAVMNIYRSDYGNPSSLHRKGLEAEKKIKEARKAVAQLIGAAENDIYFTSGGTESNNIAIQGIVNRYGKKNKHLITSAYEHHSVLNIFKHLENSGYEVTYLKPNPQGVITAESLKAALREDTALVSIMMVNNELGSIQAIKEMSQIIHNHSTAKFHVDGVQAVGKMPVHVKHLGVDAFSLSGHKLHGTKGTGAIYLKNGLNITGIYKGSGQEGGIKPGTENVPGIVALGKAAEILLEKMEVENAQIKQMRDLLAKQLLSLLDQVVINTDLENSAPHLLNVTFRGIRGEVFLHYLENDQIYVSTGAACSSKSKGSHVLRAIGLSNDDIEGTIRLSLSVLNTEAEIIEASKKMAKTVNEIRKIMKR